MTKIHGLNIVLLLIWVALTCGGLGNAAVTVDKIYWLPFVLDIPFFGYVCYKLFKTEKIVSGTGSGAALPAQNENEKEDTISDKARKKREGGTIMDFRSILELLGCTLGGGIRGTSSVLISLDHQ